MHSMGKTIGEIHAMLIEYEKGLPKKAETPQVMMIRGGKIQKANKKSLNAKCNNKVKGKGKDKKVYIPKPKNPKPTAMDRPAKDDACHHCKETRSAPASLTQSTSLVPTPAVRLDLSVLACGRMCVCFLRKLRIHSPSSSSTTLSNPSRNQTRNLVSPSSSVYTPTPPQVFEIGKCSDKMYLKHHEKQVEDILNYLDELSFHCIEKNGKEGRLKT
ncbi:hypothetical protein Tco_1064892 [Tanacetum coccineum]